MEWNEYFEMMIDWKKLPAYKAETRIDSLIGFYLNDDFEYNGKNKVLEIIYVQPANHQNEKLVIDFIWIAEWLEKQSNISSFEIELAKALRKWSKD